MPVSKATAAQPIPPNAEPAGPTQPAAFDLIFSVKNFLTNQIDQIGQLIDRVKKFFSAKKEAEQTVAERVVGGVSNIDAAVRSVNINMDHQPPSAAATQSDLTEESTKPVSAWMEIVNRNNPEPDYSANTTYSYLQAQKARATTISTAEQNGDPSNGIVSEPKGQMAQAAAKRLAGKTADKLSEKNLASER